MTFDFAKASPAEVLAEADRRARLRAKGLPLDARIPESAPTTPAANSAPRTVLLPWSVLVSDNDRIAPALRGGKPVLVQTEEYREAKTRARAIIAQQLEDRAPLEGRVKLTAILHEPDRRAGRDVSNYAKLVHDALTGLAYVDDKQIDDLHWVRGAVDIDRPRLVLTVEPLP